MPARDGGDRLRPLRSDGAEVQINERHVESQDDHSEGGEQLVELVSDALFVALESGA